MYLPCQLIACLPKVGGPTGAFDERSSCPPRRQNTNPLGGCFFKSCLPGLFRPTALHQLRDRRRLDGPSLLLLTASPRVSCLVLSPWLCRIFHVSIARAIVLKSASSTSTGFRRKYIPQTARCLTNFSIPTRAFSGGPSLSPKMISGMNSTKNPYRRWPIQSPIRTSRRLGVPATVTIPTARPSSLVGL